MSSDNKIRDFSEYENIIALSFANNADENGEVKCDLVLSGNMEKIAMALAEKMYEHPMLAKVLCKSVGLFAMPNGKELAG